MSFAKNATLAAAAALALSASTVISPAIAAVEEGTIYSLDWSNGKVATIDPLTAVVTTIFTTNPAVIGSAGMYVDPVSQKIVAPTWTSSPYPIYGIDLSAQTQSQISAAGEKVTAAATTATNNYVAYDISGTASKLGTMNSSTGAITQIADITLGGSEARVSALANCGGTIYAWYYGQGDSVYTIDTSTAALTLISADTNVTGDDVFAADCDADGNLFVIDGSKFYSSASISDPLTLVGSLSGSGFSGWLETMATYVSQDALEGGGGDGGGGDGGESVSTDSLADTGLDSSVISGWLFASLLAVVGGGALLARRAKR